MNILAIETTTKVLSVAVLNENEILGEIFINSKLNHSKTLLPTIDNLLKSLTLSLKDIDAFAISDGPGSFTGLRIGGSTVKAFAKNGNKKIVKVPTLQALAYNVGNCDKLIIPIMDARRNTVFTGSYKWKENNMIIKSEIECIDINDLLERHNKGEVIFLGDGTKLIDLSIREKFDFANINLNLNRASSVGALAFQLINDERNISNYLDYEPFYLKKSQAQREYDEKHGN